MTAVVPPVVPPVLTTEGDATIGSSEEIPSLSFSVTGAGIVEYAAVPTLRFGLRIASGNEDVIRSVALSVQVRIAPGQRGYDDATRARLVEVFGQREQWATTMRTLLWTQATLVVPAFTGTTTVDLPIACTYDFDVVATKLLHGIRDGDIPLEFLFSGTIFYSGARGELRTARISWDQDARFRLPVAAWRDLMAHYFPNSAWIRLSNDSFDKLYAFKTRRSLATWDDTVTALIGAASSDPEN